MTNETSKAVNTIWDYMQLKQPIRKADVLILLGSRDDRVAEYAVSLLKNNVAPICVVSGGAVRRHGFLDTWQAHTEADHFISKLLAAGVNKRIIYREAEATSTGENATLSYKLLKKHQIQPKSILLITKPYMERRALATFQAQWPDLSATMRVSSIGGTINEYCDEQQLLETVINVMVGDFQRLIEYPKRGFSTPQQIPKEVAEAFETLKNAGYTQNLI